MQGSRRKITLLLAVASAVAWSAAGIALTRAGWLEGTRLFLLDQLFAARQRLGRSPLPNPNVIIIGVDDLARDEVRKRTPRDVEDRWILRNIIGRLVVEMGKAKAKAVGVDFLLNVPVGQDVDDLVEGSLAGSDELGTGGVDAVLGSLITVNEQNRPLERFRQWAAEGNLIVVPDSDNKLRRVEPRAVFDDIPLFAFQVCRLFAGTPDPQTLSALRTPWRFRNAEGQDGSLEVDALARVPPRMLIDFVGPSQTFERFGRQVAALDVLNGRVPAETFRGKLVLIGPALRRSDRFAVSVHPSAEGDEYREFFQRKYGLAIDRSLRDRTDLLQSGLMSGIEVHANVASQILEGRYLHEASEELAPWLRWAIIAALPLGLGWVFWQDPREGKGRTIRRMAGGGVLFVLVLAGMGVASVWLMVNHRWVLVPLEMMAAWTGQAACGIAFSGTMLRRQNRRIEQMFGSAVGQELLDYINAHPEVMTRNERRVGTVLFSDIRGFTPLTERLGSGQIVDLLRQHFEGLSPALGGQGAWVDKYVGDLVMAAWNVLQPMDDHALRGVRAAVAMKVARAELNRQRVEAGQPPVQIGIGLHTGEVVSGNIGSRKRSNFTLIGDTVNLASRIEHEARGGEVLISDDTYALVREHVISRALPPVAIKGKTGQYVLHEVLGLVGGPMVPGKEAAAETAKA